MSPPCITPWLGGCRGSMGQVVVLVLVETVVALLSTGDPTATSLVAVVEVVVGGLTSAGEAASSLETWSCSLASCSFCQLRTDRMSG